MKRKLTYEEKTAAFYPGNKTSKTTKKLESLLLENGFTKTFSGSMDGGWGGDVDCFRLEFRKGNEHVFLNVTKPKDGVIPMSYEEWQKQKEAAAIAQGA
jgi:hypothetical protein